MIISDLQYLETVDASDVQGSRSWGGYFSVAASDADAVAVGNISIALTDTAALAVPGGAAASSSSLAISAGGGRKGKKYYRK